MEEEIDSSREVPLIGNHIPFRDIGITLS